MGRRSLWQEIRDWLSRSDEDRGEASANEVPVEGPAPSPVLRPLPSQASAARSAQPEPDWPENVVPFVRPGVPIPEADGPFESVAGVDGAGAAVLDEGFPDADLVDFMAADLDPAPADPVFRDRLREQLWEMVLEEGVARATPAATGVCDADDHGPESV